MKSLFEFEVPFDDEIPVCEINGRLHTTTLPDCTSLPSYYTTGVENHPEVHIRQEMLHQLPQGSSETQSPFLPAVHKSLVKQLLHGYYEGNLFAVLNAISNESRPLISKTASFALHIINLSSTVKRKLRFNVENSVDVIAQVSQTRNWSESRIRCIAWDNRSTKLAIATVDDCVRIYSSGSSVVPTLKCKHQSNITCMEWRPLSNSELAVGCDSGIVIWNVEPTSAVTRPFFTNAVLLRRIDHKPVLDLTWSLQGDVLYSSAAYDPRILAWNVETDGTSYLKRPGNNGYSITKLSPNGRRMFSATIGPVFRYVAYYTLPDSDLTKLVISRVWDCLSWQAERWSLQCGRIQAACWSPCSTVLLFAVAEESLIYALSFAQSEQIFTADTKNLSNRAVPVFDLSKTELNGKVIGGLVQSMQWDPKGNHLAVSFRDTNYIALFLLSHQPKLQINPSYLIRGKAGEVANVISFQKKFEYGTCLTIGWSSGRLQHFPIVCTG